MATKMVNPTTSLNVGDSVIYTGNKQGLYYNDQRIGQVGVITCKHLSGDYDVTWSNGEYYSSTGSYNVVKSIGQHDQVLYEGMVCLVLQLNGSTAKITRKDHSTPVEVDIAKLVPHPTVYKVGDKVLATDLSGRQVVTVTRVYPDGIVHTVDSDGETHSYGRVGQFFNLSLFTWKVGDQVILESGNKAVIDAIGQSNMTVFLWSSNSQTTIPLDSKLTLDPKPRYVEPLKTNDRTIDLKTKHTLIVRPDIPIDSYIIRFIRKRLAAVGDLVITLTQGVCRVVAITKDAVTVAVAGGKLVYGQSDVVVFPYKVGDQLTLGSNEKIDVVVTSVSENGRVTWRTFTTDGAFSFDSKTNSFTAVVELTKNPMKDIKYDIKYKIGNRVKVLDNGKVIYGYVTDVLPTATMVKIDGTVRSRAFDAFERLKFLSPIHDDSDSDSDSSSYEYETDSESFPDEPTACEKAPDRKREDCPLSKPPACEDDDSSSDDESDPPPKRSAKHDSSSDDESDPPPAPKRYRPKIGDTCQFTGIVSMLDGKLTIDADASKVVKISDALKVGDYFTFNGTVSIVKETDTDFGRHKVNDIDACRVERSSKAEYDAQEAKKYAEQRQARIDKLAESSKEDLLEALKRHGVTSKELIDVAIAKAKVV